MNEGSEKLNRLSSGMMRITLRIFLYTCVVLALFCGVTAAYRSGHEAFCAGGAEEAPGREITVSIEEGTSLSEASELLKKKGLLRDVRAFQIQAAFFGFDVKPGTYELNSSETVREILEELNAGEKEKLSE